MNDCECIIIGTNLEDRKGFFFETLKSVYEKESFIPYKLISIDDFGGGLSEEFKKFFEEHDFNYFVEPRRGMVKSLREALDRVDSEWVLYIEDDMTFRWLPTKEDFDKATEVKVDGRECGVMGLSVGGYSLQYMPEINSIINDKTNYTSLSNGWCAMKRYEQYRNNFFIDFPATFMKTELLKACIDKAIADGHRREIEHGITQAWFDLGLHKQYYKLSLLKYPWLDDENFRMNLDFYTNHLMPIILRKKIQIPGGHYFGDSF